MTPRSEAFVNQMYWQILGRAPDPGGLEFYGRALDNGLMSMGEIEHNLRQSPESWNRAETLVRSTYQQLFGREVDAEGLDFWKRRLVAAADGMQFTQASLVDWLSRSEEYRLRQSTGALGPGINPIPGGAPTLPGSVPSVGNNEWQSIYSIIDATLKRWDLEGLSGWAQQKLKEGASGEQVGLEIWETDVFKDRFKVIFERRNRGLSPMSPEEVIDYENRAHQLFRAAGLPEGFYDDTRNDFVDLMARNVSLAELSARIEEGFNRVSQAPVEVRARFAALTGSDGESAMAAYFLDPDKALPALEKAVRKAEILGAGDRFNISLDSRADRMADIGFDSSSVQQGLMQLDERAGLFVETAGERAQGVDLEAGREGADAVFGLSGGAADQLRRRIAARTQLNRGGGGFAMSNVGIGGTGNR